MSGYSAFIVNPKFDVNRGSVERAVWNFGGSWIIRRGTGKGRPCTDVPKAHRHLPVIDLPDDPMEAQEILYANLGPSFVPVAVDTPDVLERAGVPYAHIGAAWGPSRRYNYVFMLGNEATGLPNRWLEIADFGLSIPMAQDRKGSLNVAVAAAIVLHHVHTATAEVPA